MASIWCRKGVWWLAVRFAGRQHQRSLKTADEREARAVRARIEQTVRDVERGRLEMPPGADPWAFLLSDGKLGRPVTGAAARPPVTLGEIWEAHQAADVGRLEPNTRATQRLHWRALTRHFKPATPVAAVTTAMIQGYVKARTSVGRGGRPPVAGVTAKKEVTLLRTLFNRCHALTGERPPAVRELFAGVEYPRAAGGFVGWLTWAEIEPRAAGPDDPLWDRLFLSTAEVEAFLDWADVAHNVQRVPYLPPMLTAAAHTGARLAELTRSRVEDWDLPGRVVVLREKKRSREGDTFRRVPVTDRLAAAVGRWLAAGHPGGGLMFAREPGVRLRSCKANDRLKRFLRGSRWQVFKGYHVLRHSFASNLAAAGVDDRVIDELMGHQTESMRRHYRHLRPQQTADAVRRLFGGGGNPPAVGT